MLATRVRQRRPQDASGEEERDRDAGPPWSSIRVAGVVHDGGTWAIGVVLTDWHDGRPTGSHAHVAIDI